MGAVGLVTHCTAWTGLGAVSCGDIRSQRAVPTSAVCMAHHLAFAIPLLFELRDAALVLLQRFCTYACVRCKRACAHDSAGAPTAAERMEPWSLCTSCVSF
jgi:hypothetical protein